MTYDMHTYSVDNRKSFSAWPRICTLCRRCPADCNNRSRGCDASIAIVFKVLFSPMRQAHALARGDVTSCTWLFHVVGSSGCKRFVVRQL